MVDTSGIGSMFELNQSGIETYSSIERISQSSKDSFELNQSGIETVRTGRESRPGADMFELNQSGIETYKRIFT